MAISWGAWENKFRVGVEYTISAVTSASSSVTFTTKWYVESEYNVNDLMTLTYGGSISGSSEQNLTTGTSGGYKLWGTKTYTYTYSTYGSSPGTRTFSGSLSGVYNGATPTKSITLTIPARPFSLPAAPSSVTAVRNTDNQATVSWVRNATTAAPYTSVTVQRSLWNGTAWGAWATVATTSSTATSFVDTGVVTNSQYKYQVKANNAAGSSAYVAAAAYVKMTPAAPSAVSAALAPAGTSIVLSWTNNHYLDTNITMTIQRSVAGGAYANVVTGLAYTTTTWTDPTPGAGTNAYRVFAVQSAGPLTSAAGQSNTVSTTVPPLAPTNLTPNGVARDASQNIVLTWQHNPGGDGAAQTAFTVEYSTNGGANWTSLGEVVSTAQTATIVAPLWTNGQTVLWRVKTKGVASAGYGPVSGSATITTSATPVTTITGPPTTVTTLPLVATWTYSQAQSSAQTNWEANLYQDGVLIEARSGTTALTTTFDYRPTAGTYTLAVRTKSAAGIWSSSATRTLTISLSPPAHVTVTADYQHATGTTVLSLAATAPGAGEVAVTSASVARRVPGGDWVTLVSGISLPNDVLDLIPSTNGLTEYRVTAQSATPTYRDEAIVEVAPANPLASDDSFDRQWVFLNYGDAFTNLLRLRSNVSVSVSTDREKDGQQFLGRRKPVPAFGEARSRQVSVKGNLVHDEQGGRDDEYLWDSPPIDWEEAGLEAEVVCLRDFTGRRVFGLLSGIATDDIRPGYAALSFTVTEQEWTEAYA